MISEKYAGNAESRANNGLLSEAYINLGVLGSLFLPLVYVSILKLLSACSKGLDVRIIIIPIISVAIALISASFSIFLLTGGGLLLMLFLYSFQRYNIDIQK